MRLRARRAARLRFLLLAAATMGATPLRAQQRDTVPPPDTAAAGDTIPLPPPILVPLPAFTPVGGPPAIWSWDREQLEGEAAFTLLDLLRSVPGVTGFRSGAMLQSEAATAFGGGAGRTVVEIDGFELDPLLAPALDLATVELASLDYVRIERGMGRLRIVLRTLQPEDGRPYSRIEAGIGEPRANVFRGLLLAPRVAIGPFGFAVERIEAQGSGVARPADTFDTWIKWGFLRNDRGVQLEWRGTSLGREPDSPVPLEAKRSDLVVRARNRFAPGLIGEAFAGWSSTEVKPFDPSIADSLKATADARQLGLRGIFGRGPVEASAALRLRDHELLPRWEADLAARFSPIPAASFTLRSTSSGWRNGPGLSERAAAAAVRPLAGIEFFGEHSSGRTAAPFPGDSVRPGPIVSDRTAWRGGAALERFGIRAGGALLHVETDSVASFRLPGDTAAPALAGGSVDGWEAWATVPLFRTWLAASVSWNSWTGGTRWAYLPASSLRGSLDLHATPLPSGNLELIGRIELLRQGALPLPPDSAGAPLRTVPERSRWNAYLQIRIIDVRLFLRFDDLQAGDVYDLPDLPIRGPRLIYGVKWSFWS